MQHGEAGVASRNHRPMHSVGTEGAEACASMRRIKDAGMTEPRGALAQSAAENGSELLLAKGTAAECFLGSSFADGRGADPATGHENVNGRLEQHLWCTDERAAANRLICSRHTVHTPAHQAGTAATRMPPVMRISDGARVQHARRRSRRGRPRPRS